MNDSSFGMVQGSQRENYVNEFSPLACFCNYSTLFLIFSLIADAIYDFFSDGGSFFFHSSIKSTLFAGKDLLRLDDKQNNNGRW